MKLSLFSLASLVPFAAAHFRLVYPTARERVEDKMSIFPCGGSPSTERTKVSISNGSFPVALNMGHAETAVEMLLALGSDPGSNFNITLVPTFGLLGLGSFCLPEVSFDTSVLGVKVEDGMNATLQVQTNGDPSGGLYACADIQFSSTATDNDPSSCKNNSGITASPFSGSSMKLNANESTAEGEPQSGSSSGGHGGHGDHGSSAASLQTATWGMLGAAVVGAVAML
ncbi:hypothetical protein PHISCL_09425 [Aspergillus sclerotialis]|uniref:Copper acquisition factor BIM1-like domain-containing protein n=1 Tax=Aspergillus sclerotialis TaxID=2070753 RepID=A0A3A2Z6D0_9EURO|nr:hypothetical protein PHISCL_09425 [Aspergillus sclerotialis]